MTDFMNKLAEKALVSVLCVGALLATLGMLAAIYHGLPNALESIILGKKADTPFSTFGLVVLGWIGGFVTARRQGRGSSGDALRLRYFIATALYVAVFMLLNRHPLDAHFLSDVGSDFLVALLVWLVVIIIPWSIAAKSDELIP